MRRFTAATFTLLATALSPALAPAATSPAPGALSILERTPPALIPPRDPAGQQRLAPGHPWVAALERVSGGPWVVEQDLASGRLRRAFGAGIPLLPGERSGIPARREWSAADVERAARGFLETHAEMFGVDLAELRFVEEASSPLASVPVHPIHFDRQVGGVRVEPAQVQLVTNRGNLIYLNAVGLEPVDTSPVPSLDEAATWESLRREAERAGVSLAAAEAVGRPELVLLRVQDEAGGPVRFRLLRRHTFRMAEGLETWRAGVDAHSGELVEFADENRYACSLDPSLLQGQVRGWIKPAQATDAEQLRNFPYTALTDDGSGESSDYNGYYFYSGKTATSGLQGTFFRSICNGCTNPTQPTVSTSTDGILDFGSGGTDATGNGKSTPADRTAFYHENVARAIAAKWINRPWFATNVGVNVNIAQTCNAFWNGSTLNFFRSGGGCANTGEIRDVMQHEWGHGLDSNDGQPPVAQDRAMGEAYGDMIALFVDHDSCIGQSFWSNSSGPYCETIPACATTAPCTGVRNIDEKRASRGLMSMTTAQSKCGPASCAGPLGRECHCEGEIFGQASFHLAYNLLTGDAYDTGAPLAAGNPAFSDVAAWFLHERIFFNAATLFRSYAPSDRQSIGTGTYDAYMTVDDDDGNLANGTPNAEYINQAFVHHEIEEPTLIGDSANCVPPSDPAITLTPLMDPVSGNAQVRVSWADQGAAFYVVYRNYRLSDVWLPVRNQVLDDDRPTYEIYDEPVEIGMTYNYAVVAVGANGCPSPGADIKTLAVALPDAAVSVGQTLDPAPGGDGDGIPEPGELVQLRLDLRELVGLAGINNASITLFTRDSLATVTQPGPIPYGNVAPSATVNGPQNFEIGISTSHGCGSVVPLIAAVAGDNACLLRALAVTIPSAGCVPAPRAEATPTGITVGADNLNPACTDSDGSVDNDETVRIDVAVANPGTATANNVTVTLSSSNPNLRVTGTNPVVIATLAPSATTTASFEAQLSGAVCQETASVTARVNSNENLFPIDRTATLTLEEDRQAASYGTGFEADFGAWTSVGFTRTTFRKNAGTYAAFAGPMPQPHACDNSADGANECSTLTSPRFVPGPASQFRLANWYQLEALSGGQYWDRANVHVIESDGTHVLVRPSAGKPYPGGDADSTNLCHVDAQDGWAGNAAAGATWGTSTFNLAGWAGQEIQLEVNYNSDDLGICEGIYVDDFTLTDASIRQCDALSCNTNVPDVAVVACGAADLCASSSQSNGVIDPGEEVTFTVTLENTGGADAVDVRGDVVVVGGGTILSGGTIGGTPQLDIAAGATYNHQVVVQATGSCSQTLDVDVTNLRAGTSTFPSNLTACDRPIGASQPGGTTVLDDATGGIPIPETNQPPFLSRTLVDPVPVAVTTATLAVMVTHARPADVVIWLVGPRGGQIDATATLAGPLDVTAFVNAEGEGDYSLFLADNRRGITGTLDRWTLTLVVPAWSSCTACSGGCAAPGVTVTASRLSVCSGASLFFTASFAPPGSGSFDYEWDFGDGSPVEVVTDPFAPIGHQFRGPGPFYNVTFRARSRSSASCDATAGTTISIDPGVAPSGSVGNVLMGRRAAPGARFEWTGSGVTPPAFLVFKTEDRTQLVDSPTGIADEPMLGRPRVEWILDAGAFAAGAPLAFYEVLAENSCGQPVLP